MSYSGKAIVSTFLTKVENESGSLFPRRFYYQWLEPRTKVRILSHLRVIPNFATFKLLEALWMYDGAKIWITETSKKASPFLSSTTGIQRSPGLWRVSFNGLTASLEQLILCFVINLCNPSTIEFCCEILPEAKKEHGDRKHPFSCCNLDNESPSQ